jgi:hypothetical protein
MDSHLIFDMQSKAYDWSIWHVGFLFIGGLFAIWLGKRRPSPRAVPGVGYFMCAVAILFAVFEVGSYFLNRHEKLNLLNTDRCSVVEGAVTNFHPVPASGHAEESFVVRNERFTYSDYTITLCFNNTLSHGGPIREGLPLKIRFSDNCIIKIAAAP